MKYFLSYILLLSLKVYGAPKTELVYYYLKCPNGQQITSVALDLKKELINVDYGLNGRTNFIPWSLELNERYKNYRAESTALENKVIWKKGIRFVPSSLGLADKIDGCDVVPLVIYIRDIDYLKSHYVGSHDDYLFLDEYNRQILNVHFYNPKIAKVIFSDKYKILPPREKYFFIKYGINYQPGDIDYGSSFDLKIPVSRNAGSIVDIKHCTWWNENTPQKCDLIRIGTGFFFMKNVEFWKNGIIRSAEIPDYYFWPKDWNNPSGKKVQCSSGLISYRFTGELDSCVDMKEVP